MGDDDGVTMPQPGEVTLGELSRRIDRMDRAISAELIALNRLIAERVVTVGMWQMAQDDIERRVQAQEDYRMLTETRFRTTVLALVIAIVSGCSGILVAGLTAH